MVVVSSRPPPPPPPPPLLLATVVVVSSRPSRRPSPLLLGVVVIWSRRRPCAHDLISPPSRLAPVQLPWGGASSANSAATARKLSASSSSSSSSSWPSSPTVEFLVLVFLLALAIALPALLGTDTFIGELVTRPQGSKKTPGPARHGSLRDLRVEQRGIFEAVGLNTVVLREGHVGSLVLHGHDPGGMSIWILPGSSITVRAVFESLNSCVGTSTCENQDDNKESDFPVISGRDEAQQQ